MHVLKSLFVAAVLLVSCDLGTAKVIADRQLEFEISMPEQTKVDVAENEQGRSVTAVYQDADTQEAFTLLAVRANNGGFDVPLESFFSGMIDGTSKTLGKRPRMTGTLRYLGYELHVAQHVGVGANGTQTLISVVFLQERGNWRKIIAVQFICNGSSIRSDGYILERLQAAQFRPTA